ncbi:MAG: phosphoglycolate phosphatase [Methanoculleaceae archaeon]
MLTAVITDVDGTITDRNRRIHTPAIEWIRRLVDGGIPVVLASGNTHCFMNSLCRMIGTDGTLIAENGGMYRIGYTGDPVILGDQKICWDAFYRVQTHFASRGVSLKLYSPELRYTDVAFARTVSPEDVRRVIGDDRVVVIDTGFAIHLQCAGISKGRTLVKLAREMDREPGEFLAVGDAANDSDMLSCAGLGVAVANAHPDAMAAADSVTTKTYGEGFVEAMERFSHLLL